MGSASLVIQSGSLTSYVACLLLCKNIFMGISCLALCTKSFTKLSFNFMFSSVYLTPMWSISFSLLFSWLRLRSPVMDGLARGTCAEGGSKVRNLLSLGLYPKCVHFASLMWLANCWGPKRRAPLTKGLITPQIALHCVTHTPQHD
jgi:hypothetical protein